MAERVYHSDEISLKEIVLKLQDYANTLWHRKWLIAAVAILFAAGFAIRNTLTSPVFPAKLTFMINEDDAGSKLGLGGILGQFGLGSSGTEFNLDKVLELSKSRKISQKALFNGIEINGKKDFLANHLIFYLDSLGTWGKRSLHKEWFGPEERLPLKGFTFSKDSLDSKIENKALKSLHTFLVGNSDAGIDAIVESEYSETSGIMSLKSTTEHPALSVNLTQYLFDELSEYYIKKTIEKQKHTYDILKDKTDSISTALSSAQYSLANFKDRNQNIFSRTESITENKLMLEIQKLTVMYAEAEKNLQVADLSLKNKTPYIQMIDEPLLPIAPKKPSIIQALIKGLLLGLCLGVVFVLLKKIVRDSLNN